MQCGGFEQHRRRRTIGPIRRLWHGIVGRRLLMAASWADLVPVSEDLGSDRCLIGYFLDRIISLQVPAIACWCQSFPVMPRSRAQMIAAARRLTPILW